MESKSAPAAECQSCGYEAVLTAYTDLKGRAFRFCDLCAGTRAGNATRHPDQYEQTATILQTVCYVGNAILDAIKARP